jgi:dihydrofolate reductase
MPASCPSQTINGVAYPISGMRKIVVLSFISLDGVMQAPGGPEEDDSGGFKYGGWTFPYFDDFSEKVMAEQMGRPYDLLLGRKTYDIFASYWPYHRDRDMGINGATKYVVSRHPLHLTWERSIQLNGDVVNAIRDLKTVDGPMLQVHGSGDLIQTLLRNDLVDELWLKIFPITLGPGKRLFADGAIPAGFALIDCKVSPKGIIIANYRRSGNVMTGTF